MSSRPLRKFKVAWWSHTHTHMHTTAYERNAAGAAATASKPKDSPPALIKVDLKPQLDGSILVNVVPKALHGHILEGITEDDPTSLFVWTAANVTGATNAINAANPAGTPTPALFNGVQPVFPITDDHLMIAIVRNVGQNSGGIVGNSLITPNNLAQYTEMVLKCGYLSLNLLFAVVPPACFPLANHYAIAGRVDALRATPTAIALVPGAPGQVIA